MFRFTREFAQKLRAPSRHKPKRSRQAQPILEAVESRLLLSAGVAPHAAHRAPHAVLRPVVNPLDRYTVFQATIQSGPNAGMTLQGPLVLYQTGRIQVFGYLYQTSGPPITVVGTAIGGGGPSVRSRTSTPSLPSRSPGPTAFQCPTLCAGSHSGRLGKRPGPHQSRPWPLAHDPSAAVLHR